MIGSNEDYWREYQQEPAKGLRKTRLVQSGTDKGVSFNFFRGGLLVLDIVIVIAVILVLVWL